MRVVVILGLVLLYSRVLSQSPDLEINTLNAPSSPVFNLMGINPTEIERPKDPTDFNISLRNATDGFTALPQNYSVEVAPVWVFGGRNIKYSQFESSQPKYSIPQSLVLSLGTRVNDQIDTANHSQVGLGVKFTILRGRLTTEFKEKKHTLDSLLAEYNTTFAQWSLSFEATDSTYKVLERILIDPNTPAVEKKRVRAQMIERKEAAFDKEKGELQQDATVVREQIEKLDFRRVGFLLDFAAGMVIDFPGNLTANGRIGRFGAWLTGGFAGENLQELEVLGLARYLYSKSEFQFISNTDSTFLAGNVHYFDLGVKLNLRDRQGKFSAGAEGVARFSSNTGTPFWRYSVNLNYQVASNKVFSFSVGQDYSMRSPETDSNVSLRKEDLILALNLVLGFGNKRP